jgi:hypothetical protein
VIDPPKVVRCALQNASSIAGLLITTEAMVAETVPRMAAKAALKASSIRARALASPRSPTRRVVKAVQKGACEARQAKKENGGSQLSLGDPMSGAM